MTERVNLLIDLIQANPSLTFPAENQEKLKNFNNNSQYQVIIFYEDRSALAGEIKTSLLNQGYFSTTTQTDFKELPPQIYNPKTIRIVYTSTGEGGIDGVLKVLKDKGYTEQKKNLTQARAEDLRSGNIQIYIF